MFMFDQCLISLFNTRVNQSKKQKEKEKADEVKNTAFE